jgi:hypothetical protein
MAKNDVRSGKIDIMGIVESGEREGMTERLRGLDGVEVEVSHAARQHWKLGGRSC